MSGYSEPLLNPEEGGGKTIQSYQISQLDKNFSSMQSKLERFFTSMQIGLSKRILLTYFSHRHRKIFIYSDESISVFDLESKELESTNPVSSIGVVSMTSNDDSIFLGTRDAFLIHISIPSFKEVNRIKICSGNLFVSCHDSRGVWAVSSGYNLYYYNLENQLVYKAAWFPWASGGIISPDGKCLIAYNDNLVMAYSNVYRFVEKRIQDLNSISKVEFSKNSKLMLVAHSSGVNVFNVTDWTILKSIQTSRPTNAKFYGINNYVVYCNRAKISVWNPYNEVAEQEFVYGTQIEDVS